MTGVQTCALPIFFPDGERRKLKGDAYKIAHKQQSGVTPLGVWELAVCGIDLKKAKASFPEEFWDEYEALSGYYEEKFAGALQEVRDLYAPLAILDDKALGQALKGSEHPYKNFVFQLRKFGDGFDDKARPSLAKFFRPGSDRLPEEVQQRLSAMALLSEPVVVPVRGSESLAI